MMMMDRSSLGYYNHFDRLPLFTPEGSVQGGGLNTMRFHRSRDLRYAPPTHSTVALTQMP